MTDQLPQDEKELLRSEIRVAHEAADITAQLVIKQFEETYQVLQKLETVNENLHASEENYRLILDLSPEPIILYDAQGRVTLVNRAFIQTFGWHTDEMADEHVGFVPEDRKTELNEYIRFGLRHGHVQDIETQRYTRDGTLLDVQASATFIKDKKGRLSQTIVIMRNITERKRMEADLREARDAAEAANQSKSTFLANMSHELRTPLNSIIGFTRIVRRKAEGTLPEKQLDNLDKVLGSAEHLLNLINTVLDIAKIEAGRMDVMVASFDINELIDICANTSQPLLRPGVILETHVDENLSTIQSDQGKIKQVILNLLSNAAKFTHEGSIVLVAKQDGSNLRISVSDTGIGISEEAMTRIFKEFQQADTSTTREYGGTGLGLSISRKIAHLLGGDINMQSEVGKGSTFSLIIPIEFEKRRLPHQEAGTFITPDGKPDAGPETVHHTQPATVKKRLLVIDDDPDAVYLLQESLYQQQYEIIGMRNGADGLRIAGEQKPDAILLDIVMPGTDGWQVLNSLKANPETADIPVILLTIVDKKALGFKLGASAYLLKPLDPVAVREALVRVLGESARRPKHILVVDDDPSVADMLRQFLPESEFQMDSALDGIAGLEAVAAHRPDIILLDIMMPRLDGFGVIESLRTDPKTCDLPIIVISAKELTVAESNRLQETVSTVVKKQGFQGEKLIDEIKSVLR